MSLDTSGRFVILDPIRRFEILDTDGRFGILDPSAR